MNAKRQALGLVTLVRLPEDLQVEVMSHLDPVSLAALECTSSAALKLSEPVWDRLITAYFHCTLLNPPLIDSTWTARTKFRYLFHFESPHRPLWLWRMSTVDLWREVRTLGKNAHPSFWDGEHSDYELIDDVCQTLRHLVPKTQPSAEEKSEPAAVDMPFEAYVTLLLQQVRELAQRGSAAQPWMMHKVQPGDVLHHLEASDAHRDFWRVMAVTNGIVLLQPLGAVADVQGRWGSFPRQVYRSQLSFDYFMTQNHSAGCGRMTTPGWHTSQRRLSWEFALLMVYGNEEV